MRSRIATSTTTAANADVPTAVQVVESPTTSMAFPAA
jgi:hypothetical protein